MGAVQFIEGIDRTSFTITDAEFEKNVEAAVSAIAEGHAPASPPTSPEKRQNQRHPSPHRAIIAEKSALSKAEVTPRNSLEAERVTPRLSTSSRSGSHAEGGSADDGEEKAAVAGLLRTIQRPLSTIGRIFSDDSALPSQQQGHQRQRSVGQPALTPTPESRSRLSPVMPSTQRRHSEDGRMTSERRQEGTQQEAPAQQGSAEDAAARQASAELAEAQRITRAEHRVVVE